MANEWTKVELYGANNDGTPRRYTIANATSVSKGQLLSLIDPRTVGGGAASAAAVAGVASEDHLANQGITSISVWTDGIFEAVAYDAIGVGAGIMAAGGGNKVLALDVASAASIQFGTGCFGYSLEAAEAAETVNVRLQV